VSIIDRLRASALSRSKAYDRERHSNRATPLVTLLDDAADEIGRLQGRLDAASARASDADGESAVMSNSLDDDREEDLTNALACVAIDFGADPDILGGLWDSRDCIEWLNKVHAALGTNGITVVWGHEDHEPVVLDARAEKAESKLAALLEDLLKLRSYTAHTGSGMSGPWISACQLGHVIEKHSLNGDAQS